MTFSATLVGGSLQVSNVTFGNGPGIWTVQVTGSVSSSAFSFSVLAPRPAITSPLPGTAAAGGAAFSLKVGGTQRRYVCS
jgi:hypothetical protein